MMRRPTEENIKTRPTGVGMIAYKLTAQHEDGVVLSIKFSTLEGDKAPVDLAKVLGDSGKFNNVTLVVNKEKKVSF